MTKLNEFGNGMYVYVQDTSMIADSFAECLGGLVSVFGLDLQVRVEVLGDVKINKCLSTGYDINTIKADKIYEILINNIQSEENKDLLFELCLNKHAKCEKQDIVKVMLNYLNVPIEWKGFFVRAISRNCSALVR